MFQNHYFTKLFYHQSFLLYGMLDGLVHNLSSDYQASYLYGLHHETNPVLT